MERTEQLSPEQIEAVRRFMRAFKNWWTAHEPCPLQVIDEVIYSFFYLQKHLP
jgi:hypothetical protein